MIFMLIVIYDYLDGELFQFGTSFIYKIIVLSQCVLVKLDNLIRNRSNQIKE